MRFHLVAHDLHGAVHQPVLLGERLVHDGQPRRQPAFGELPADATGLWGLSESALRKAVEYRKLTVGVDVQKFGKQWVVTRSAMEREYGRPSH